MKYLKNTFNFLLLCLLGSFVGILFASLGITIFELFEIGFEGSVFIAFFEHFYDVFSRSFGFFDLLYEAIIHGL